jgi:hypothetical protein
MAIFAISDGEPLPHAEIEIQLFGLLEFWVPSEPRQFMPDSAFVVELKKRLNDLIDLRVNRVRSWLDCNLARFQGGHAAIEELRRRFDNIVIEMKTNVQLCGAQCLNCHLFCVRSRLHESDHSCNTDHRCAFNCEFCEDNKLCGLRYGNLSLFGAPIKESVALGILGSICRWSVPGRTHPLIMIQLCCHRSPVR